MKILKFFNGRGPGVDGVKFNEKEVLRSMKKTAMLWMAFEDSVMASNEVCFKGNVMIVNNELVYYVAPQKAVYVEPLV